MLIAYRAMLLLLSGLLLLITVRDARRRHGGLRFVRERLGFASHDATPCQTWVHAASVGEVRAAGIVIEAARQHGDVLVTTNTPEAARVVKGQYGRGVIHCYCPIDFAWACRRLISRFGVKRLFVMETELWPNLFNEVERAGVDLYLVNGRLSERTLNAPGWLRGLYRRCLRSVTAVWARSDRDAQGFMALGCEPDKIEVVGNIKFCAVDAADTTTGTIPELAGTPYVLAGSTHEGEDLHLADIWAARSSAHLMVLMPRHPVRGNRIVETLRARGFAVAQRSRQEQIATTTQFYIADTVGEFFDFVRAADWVFMGGSLTQRGGHNLLEPAALGKAIVTGSGLDNFEAERDVLLANEALLVVNSWEEFAVAVEQLEADPNLRTRLGNNAAAAMASTSAIVTRYQQLLANAFDPSAATTNPG